MIEIFKNHKLIKIFQKENFENIRSEKFIDGLKEKNKKIAIVNVRSTPFMEFLTGIMIAVLIYYSGKLIINDEISINNFFSFLAAMMLAYQPVRSLATITIAYNQGLAGARRILPIIDNKNEIFDKPESLDLKISESRIEFKNVNFNYSTVKKEILKSVDLNIKGGKMTALVGLSGSGKSTILNLIPRFYNINSGDILIDDQSIYNCKLFSLRKNISLVSQDTTLFDDTIIKLPAFFSENCDQYEDNLINVNINCVTEFSGYDEYVIEKGKGFFITGACGLVADKNTIYPVNYDKIKFHGI